MGFFGIDEFKNTDHPIHMTAENTKNQTSFCLRIQPYSAKHIANSVGCSVACAYDWRSGRRAPPAWMQHSILEDLASYHPQIKYAHENETD